MSTPDILRRWFRSLIAVDPYPSYSRLDNLDGLNHHKES